MLFILSYISYVLLPNTAPYHSFSGAAAGVGAGTGKNRRSRFGVETVGIGWLRGQSRYSLNLSHQISQVTASHIRDVINSIIFSGYRSIELVL